MVINLLIRENSLLWPVIVICLDVFMSRVRAECSRPHLQGNVMLSGDSIFKNDFPENSVVTLQCAHGHVAQHGSPDITCVDGKWSLVELSCTKMDCGQPIPSANMHYEVPEGTLFGAFVQPVCARGYQLDGTSHRQCLAKGWFGHSECKVAECDHPETILNGVSDWPGKEYPKVGDVIKYSCDDGYTLIGNSSIYCTEDSKYIAPPPQCAAIECPAPAVTFLRVEGSPPYGLNSTISAECPTGYRMQGSPHLTCEESGWSSPFPECIEDHTTIQQATTELQTTSSTTATPRIRGREDNHTSSLPKNSDIFVMSGVIIVTVVISAGLTICLLYICLWKKTGSYSTGEDLGIKEEPLLFQTTSDQYLPKSIP